MPILITNMITFWPIMFKQSILYNGSFKKQKDLHILQFHTKMFPCCTFTSLREQPFQKHWSCWNCKVFLNMRHQKGKCYLVFSPPLQRIFLWAKFSCSRYVLTTILESTKSKMMSSILLSHLLLIFSPLHPFAFVLHLSLPLMLSLKYVTIFLQLRQMLS